MSESSIQLDPTKSSFAPSMRIEDIGDTHFIGIGGAGMSVLAEILNQRGIRVDGSDKQPNEKTEHLQSLGIDVQFGQRAENINHPQCVVYSSAIKADNPEIIEAARQGALLVHRSDILDIIMRDAQAITVAGAHGKTTTSSMIAHLFTHTADHTLADPSYAIGGSIQAPDGSTADGGHAGTGPVFVAEADESDGSFEKYHPSIAVVTNAEPDHLDHYHDAQHYHDAFVRHVAHAQDAIIMCSDDEGVMEVFNRMDDSTAARTILYGTKSVDPAVLRSARFVHITDESEQTNSGLEEFTMHIPASITHQDDEMLLPVQLRVPGLHNARNATAAILAAIVAGMNPQEAARAITSFLGAARRFQIHGVIGGITVVDDYAHHPTEIAALLEATRRRYPQATVHVLFQPHLFSRTQFFAKEFAQNLATADDVIVTGIFPAREKQEDYPDITAHTITDQMDAQHAQSVEDMVQAAQMMAMRANPGDVILTVGAGDITQVAPVITHALEARFADGE